MSEEKEELKAQTMLRYFTDAAISNMLTTHSDELPAYIADFCKHIISKHIDLRDFYPPAIFSQQSILSPPKVFVKLLTDTNFGNTEIRTKVAVYFRDKQDLKYINLGKAIECIRKFSPDYMSAKVSRKADAAVASMP